MSGAKGGAGDYWVPGTPPRANLLPPEITVRRRQLQLRRRARSGLLLSALVVAAAGVGAFGYSGVATARLAVAQGELSTLLAEQATYSDVESTLSTIELITAGRIVGASTEIEWRDYLTKLRATLPDGMSLDSLVVTSVTPITAFDQPVTPLQGQRIARLTFTATSPTLPSIPAWLDELATLPGFADAVPGQVSLSDGSYTVQVVMHITEEAFAGRFPAESGSEG